MPLGEDGQKAHDEFIKQSEQSIAAAIKGMWDNSEKNAVAEAFNIKDPSDGQFTQWAHELIHERRMTLVDPTDPEHRFPLDMGLLKTQIAQNAKTQEMLKARFKTDQLDEIILDEKSLDKAATIVGNAADKNQPSIMDYIIGFFGWLFSGAAFSSDGPSLHDYIAKPALDNAAAEVNQQLSAQVPGIKPGMRDYIVGKIRTAGLDSAGPAPTLADIEMGQDRQDQQPTPGNAPTSPAAPTTEAGAAAATTVTGPAPKLEDVLTAMSTHFLVNQKATPKELEDGNKNFLDVGTMVMKDKGNRALLEKGDLSGFSKILVTAVMADDKMGPDMRKKIAERTGSTNARDIDSILEATLSGDLSEQIRDGNLPKLLLAATAPEGAAPAAPGANAATTPAAETSAIKLVAPSEQKSLANLEDAFKKTIMERVVEKIKLDAVNEVVAKYNGGGLTGMYLRGPKGPSEISVFTVANSERCDPNDVKRAREDIYQWAHEHEFAPDKFQAARIGLSVADAVIPVLSDPKNDPKNPEINREAIVDKLKLATRKGLDKDASFIDSVGAVPIAKVNHRTFGENDDVLGKVVAAVDTLKTDDKFFGQLQAIQTTLAAKQSEEKEAQLAAAAAKAGINPRAKDLVKGGETPTQAPGTQLTNRTAPAVSTNGRAS